MAEDRIIIANGKGESELWLIWDWTTGHNDSILSAISIENKKDVQHDYYLTFKNPDEIIRFAKWLIKNASKLKKKFPKGVRR